MKKVGVFVVGAGKSGTTYIYDKFLQHLEIYVSEKRKELHYFNNEFYEKFNYEAYFRNAKINQIIADISFFIMFLSLLKLIKSSFFVLYIFIKTMKLKRIITYLISYYK